MKMRLIIGLVLLTSMVVVSCTKQDVNSTNKSVSTTNQTESSTKPATSPTDTFRAFCEAAQKKDTQAIKKGLSKSSLKSLEEFAQKQNKTVDDVLRDPSGVPQKIPEMRNEKINGDSATLEYKDDQQGGKWFEVPFVKENGEWKIDIDKVKPVG